MLGWLASVWLASVFTGASSKYPIFCKKALRYPCWVPNDSLELVPYCAHRRQRNAARAHTQLKNKAPSPVGISCARVARARDALHTCLAPRNNRPASHIATPQARTNGLAPPRSRRLAARPSAGNHHQHFCLTTMTTKHERRTSPRRNMHTQLKSSSSRNTDA